MEQDQVAQELVGKIVRAKTFGSIEYDREPQGVVGKLSKRHVDTLDYDQYLVEAEDGDYYLVDPETIVPTTNAFCPTGKGGGIDPTCSSGKTGKTGPKLEQVSVERKTLTIPHRTEGSVEFSYGVVTGLPDPMHPDSVLPEDNEHLYHYTTLDKLRSIARDGLTTTKEKSTRTDIGGEDTHAYNYALTDSDPNEFYDAVAYDLPQAQLDKGFAMLRLKTDVRKWESDPEFLGYGPARRTKQDVDASSIQILTLTKKGEHKWVPLTQWVDTVALPDDT